MNLFLLLLRLYFHYGYVPVCTIPFTNIIYLNVKHYILLCRWTFTMASLPTDLFLFLFLFLLPTRIFLNHYLTERKHIVNYAELLYHLTIGDWILLMIIPDNRCNWLLLGVGIVDTIQIVLLLSLTSINTCSSSSSQ